MDIVARFGGEEFVIVLPETDSLSALLVAESLRRDVAALGVPVGDNGVHVSVTVSIGVATLHQGAILDFEDLVSRADKALYRAKQAGRNAVFCADLQHDSAPLHVLPESQLLGGPRAAAAASDTAFAQAQRAGGVLVAGWPSSV